MTSYEYGTPEAEEFLKMFDMGEVVEDVEAEVKFHLDNVDQYAEYIESYKQLKAARSDNKNLQARAEYIRKTGRKLKDELDARNRPYYEGVHHSDISYKPQRVRDREEVIRLINKGTKAGAVREDVLYTPEEFGAEEVAAVKLTSRFMYLQDSEYYAHRIIAKEANLYLYRKGDSYYIYLETRSCQIV